MYKIFADSTLIYDSTIEDYKIGKGEINLEIEKAGSFVFSMYPDNPYYDKIVEMKTIITVYKENQIVFRGRALKTEDGFYNCRIVTCEGELAFLLDSVIRPYNFTGSPKALFTKFIQDHNAQVDAEKRFKIGQITVSDNNDYIARSNVAYEDTWTNIKDRLIGDSLGGYLYVSHDEDGSAVINYFSDFPYKATQTIEFGENLKDYTKTTNAEDIATVLIPLGGKLKDAEGNDTDELLTIASVNNGKDYIEDATAIAIYGRIVKVVQWEDVTLASRLLSKGKSQLSELIKKNVTIDLTAVDLHLLDRSIESFRYAEYITVLSEPHALNVTMLCKKQTINLLKPDNDSVSLGYTYATFTETTANTNKNAVNVQARISSLTASVNNTITEISGVKEDVGTTTEDVTTVAKDLEAVVSVVQANTVQISQNTADISQLKTDVESISEAVTDINTTASRAEVQASNAAKSAEAAAKVAESMDNRVSLLEGLGLFVGEDGAIYQREETDK